MNVHDNALKHNQVVSCVSLNAQSPVTKESGQGRVQSGSCVFPKLLSSSVAFSLNRAELWVFH